MTDKELIKNEIESRIQECKDSKIDSSYYDGLISAFEEVRDFINSLPEEPVSDELEEVAFDNAQKNYKEGFRGAAMQAFNEGAEWQKEQMTKSVLASQEMTCIQVAHRLIGSSWNLACPTDKIGLKSNDKVKVIIIKD